MKPISSLPELNPAARMQPDAATVNPATLVSIGMPVYNCEKTIVPAIQSILNQTFPSWELLLMDDGSSDHTLAAARSFSDPRIHVFADGLHLGLVARLNQAIDLSRGSYFARMDGDDISYPERFRLQVEYLERHVEIDLLAGGILIFRRSGEILGSRATPTTHQDICRRPFSGFYFAHPTWMGRTAWFRKHRYHSDAVRCEDQDLLLRTYENSRFAALPDIVLGYREEELSLKKLLTGRRSFAQSVVRTAALQSRYIVAAAAFVEQMLKGFIDCVAISSGLKYWILRHRAMGVKESEKQRWNNVWDSIHKEAACAEANR